jgi:hypothetical protein
MLNIKSGDDDIFAGRHMRDAQAKWDRLSLSDLAEIKTKAQLIARVEERYVLPHEVAAQDVEIWGLARRF